ncbi:DNA glycosylase AlkZ-like family protein [Granulicella arctica]|uniref:Winged helix DNA-binding domain-containing protein n=1 Tax=Granulicella arctica TaxID=940613 RepID=A0A7Y9TEU1_9BACT|nr:crosslink repair DNA glycosylase YcaQ family protein [Granulicella arctica]NYF78041.1 hypothetical protein [Granulicella arctica]
MTVRFAVTRSQILSFRRQQGFLDERLPAKTESLRKAAWGGLQDSVPRAALLSIHARVDGTISTDWNHSSLVQLWGPRFNVYVVAAQDLALFSLGRLPVDTKRLARAEMTARRLQTFLNGRSMPFGEAGRGIGVVPNSLRYAAPTGTVLMRWNGAHQPIVWTVPPPDMEPQQARLELARRYLHVFGPATSATFARWAGIPDALAHAAFKELAGILTPVRTPTGDAWILAKDETTLRAQPRPAAPARLLPSGDAFYLAWGADREILVPNAKRRPELWTSRVWPGALLVGGEITGVWRRSSSEVSIDVWRRLTWSERDAVETEAMSLPLPDLNRPITVRWAYT